MMVLYMSRVMGNKLFAYAKTKTQIMCAVTRTDDQRLCFRHIDSTIPLLPTCISEIKPLAIFCSYTAWFVSDQVRNKKFGFLMARLICRYH